MTENCHRPRSTLLKKRHIVLRAVSADESDVGAYASECNVQHNIMPVKCGKLFNSIDR